MNIEKNNIWTANLEASIKEIGSEFWLDTLPEQQKITIPKWISKFGDIAFTSSGRGAITLLLEQIRPKNKSVLLPAYICESVILPFVQKGYKCFFYGVDEKLTLEIEEIKSFKDIGVFVHLGYYGFPTNSNLVDVIKKLKDQSTIVVEDVTHTLFSEFNRFEKNDYYVASLRKWFGLPSGGFLSSSKDTVKKPELENELVSNIRKEALLLKSKYIKTGNERVRPKFLEKFSIGEKYLDGDIGAYCIDDISLKILSTQNINNIISKRRENFQVLLEGLRKSNNITVLFPKLTEGICPLFFPIIIKNNRKEVQKKMAKNKVFCPIHWPTPKQINLGSFSKGTQYIYEGILSLPCDQRYDRDDMQRVLNELEKIT